MDKDVLEELRSHLMNACSANQMLATKLMKHRSLYLLLLLLLCLPQLCSGKKNISYNEKKEETCKSGRNSVLNPRPILIWGFFFSVC